MKTSESINEVATALAAAQAEIQNPVKDAENPHFRSTYADLAGGLSVARPILAKHGIAIVQATSMEGDVMLLETRLIHKSGQWVGEDYPVCRFPAKQQEIGSALTYARRYSLFSIVGIAGEDDDGNEASKAETPAPRKQQPPVRQQQRRDDPPPPVDDFPFPGDDHEASEEEAAGYIKIAMGVIDNWTSNVVQLKEWWDEEAVHRERAGVVNGTPEYKELFQHFKDRGLALAGRVAPAGPRKAA